MRHYLEELNVCDLGILDDLIRAEHLQVEVLIEGRSDKLIAVLDGFDFQVGWLLHLYQQAKEQRQQLLALLPPELLTV